MTPNSGLPPPTVPTRLGLSCLLSLRSCLDSLSLPFLAVRPVLLALPSSSDVLVLELYCSRIIAQIPPTVL
jgi:hypothetical protein